MSTWRKYPGEGGGEILNLRTKTAPPHPLLKNYGVEMKGREGGMEEAGSNKHK